MKILKKCLIILLVISITLFAIYSKTKFADRELTMKEKVEDFDYLYKTIKENYPFLEVNKRVYAVDWLAEYDEFLKKIKATQNDLEFFNALNDTLRKLNNGHTHMLNVDEFKNLRELYSRVGDGWQSKVNLSVLNNKKSLKRYGFYKNEKIEKVEEHQNKENISVINASVRDVVDKKIAYISIPIMINPSMMKRDMELLDEYLESVKNYQALIIDIRGNLGGDSRYWRDYLVPKMIDKKYETVNYIFWRDGEIMRKFFDESKCLKNSFVGKVKDLDTSSLVNLPKEINEDFEYYFKMNSEIVPNKDSINFKGNIYLLVDEEVYSSAELFASFAKNSKLATLIGNTTGGDGAGSDPLFVNLPNSGYVFRFSKDMGVDSTGICNEEFKTEPHYKVSKGYLEDYCINKVLELEGLK